MQNNRKKGNIAEIMAIDFLINNGYSIINKNYQKDKNCL